MSFRDRINQMALTCADQIVTLVNEFTAPHFSKFETHELALYPVEYQNNPQNGLHRARVRAAMVPKPDMTEAQEPGLLIGLDGSLLQTPPGRDPRSLQGMVPVPSSPEDGPLVLPSWEDVVGKYPAIEVYMDFGVIDPAQNALASFQSPTGAGYDRPATETGPRPGQLRETPADRENGRSPFGIPSPTKVVPWYDYEHATPLADLIGAQRMFEVSMGRKPDVARMSTLDIDHARRTKELLRVYTATYPNAVNIDGIPPRELDAQVFFDLLKEKTGMTIVIDDNLTQAIQLEMSPEQRVVAPMPPPPLRGVVPKSGIVTCPICGNKMLPWQPRDAETAVLRCVACGETKSLSGGEPESN